VQYCGHSICNNIPQEIRSISDLNDFKRALKHHLFSRYFLNDFFSKNDCFIHLLQFHFTVYALGGLYVNVIIICIFVNDLSAKLEETKYIRLEEEE